MGGFSVAFRALDVRECPQGRRLDAFGVTASERELDRP
jgi:hypothetical protein